MANPTSMGAEADRQWRQELCVDPSAQPLALKAEYSGKDAAAIHAMINAPDRETIPLTVRVDDIEQYCLTHRHGERTIKANIRRLSRGPNTAPGFDEANDFLDALRAFAQDGISGEDTGSTAAVAETLSALSDPAKGDCMTPAQAAEISSMLSKPGSTVEKVGRGSPTVHQIAKILSLL